MNAFTFTSNYLPWRSAQRIGGCVTVVTRYSVARKTLIRPAKRPPGGPLVNVYTPFSVGPSSADLQHIVEFGAMQIRISWPAGHLTATLEDTPTTTALEAALPLASTARTWGEEVYFATPVSPALEADAQQVVEPGTVAFWTDGDALALPYGPTPISRGDECRLASRCNILGSIDGDPRHLATVRDGDPVRVERA